MQNKNKIWIVFAVIMAAVILTAAGTFFAGRKPLYVGNTAVKSSSYVPSRELQSSILTAESGFFSEKKEAEEKPIFTEKTKVPRGIFNDKPAKAQPVCTPEETPVIYEGRVVDCAPQE